MHVIIHLSKPIEYTTPRVTCNVNQGLWVIMMCQCWFINVTNVPLLLITGEAMNLCRQGVYGKSLYLPLNFAVNLKLLLKKSFV